MLADLDYFYAQVEERRNPSLRGRPVVVCVYSGRTEESGVVATANYAARSYGVRSGIPIAVAKKKLAGKDAVFIKMDHDYYKEVSAKVMEIIKRNSGEFEQVGIDEAYIEVSEKASSFSEATELARRIKAEVKEKESLTLSIGIGTNKVIAKIASEIHKPDGLTVIEDADSKKFLAALPVDKLPGVGKKTSERMSELGINRIGDLAAYDKKALVKEFGHALGNYFHKASNGEDESPVLERGESESISRIATLKVDTKNVADVVDFAYELCNDVIAKVRARGVLFKTVGIIAITTSLSIKIRNKSLSSPTDDLQIMKRTVKELFEMQMKASRQELRRVGVNVSGFKKREEGQSQLTGFM